MAPAPYPSWSPEDFPKCEKHAQHALQLAHAAAAREPSSVVASRDLAWARASMLRFAPGSASGAERTSAESAYAEAMREIGVPCHADKLVAHHR